MTADLQTIINQNNEILKRLDAIEEKDLLKRYGTRMTAREVLIELGYKPNSKNTLQKWDQQYKIIDHKLQGTWRIYITSKVLDLKNRLGK